MAITAEAPRGGVVEEIDDATYPFVLRIREIERFEDKHRGIFEVWDGFFQRGRKPTSAEVRDLAALALVGGGMTDAEADAVISRCGPDKMLRLYAIAQAALGVAFVPDVADGDDAEKKRQADLPLSD